ncbi:MAG: aminopeptidase [Bacteroides sp.]|nr:aminopeptidase [Clostridium sp.]MCM1459723.1 aminopeptidase [Bacteroides sp.]
MEDIWERIMLAIERLGGIEDEEWEYDSFDKDKQIFLKEIKQYFNQVSAFILYLYDVYQIDKQDLDADMLREINTKLYEDILPQNYDVSYGNPDYAAARLGEEYGKVMSFLYSEIRACIVCVYENKLQEFVAVMELFLQIYGMFSQGAECPGEKYIREAIYYHMYDYADVMVEQRTRETMDSSFTFATDIIMNSDFGDIKYLYLYGEYIGENEIKTATFLNQLSEEQVQEMAATYVCGFIKGFEVMGIDLEPKKTVNIRYSIGQERMVKYAIELFREKGLSPVIFRYAASRINRKQTLRVGYVATPANKQYDYDHRMDEALFLDKAFAKRKLEVIEETYEKYKDLAAVYAGPAVIETFGENPFQPSIKDTVNKLDEKQKEISRWYSSKSVELSNRYMPRDKYSYTIIAYPIPEIGEKFEEIFEEIVKVNTLDNELYKKIQQSIIDELDRAEYVHVLGRGDNQTDIKVMLHEICDPQKETKFENCLADVNIPLGEVFTSPVLSGTNGTLNVSQVYLNELKFNNLKIEFEDGKIKQYTCDNFEDEAENQAFIKENLMFNHDTLPIGEFAIGTNTTAYVMAHKYDILYKLPILIVEKMGPHFAVGDTCYSYSEDSAVYNPDGKEIIARDNECSSLRNSEDSKQREQAYFNCHTDITIPYEEIGGIYSVHEDGSRVPVILDGRFVLAGTDELNQPFGNN